MNLPIVLYVILGVGLIALAVWAGRRAYKERVTTKAEQPTLEWVINVEKATSDDDIVAVKRFYVDTYRGQRHLRDTAREGAACQKFDDANRRVKSRQLGKELMGTPNDTAMGILRLCTNGLDSQLAFGVDESELPRLFQDALSAMMNDVRQNRSLTALYGYKAILDDYGLGAACTKMAIAQPTYPADWDDLVVSMMPSPTVSDFKNVGDKAVGEVQLMAGEALRTHSIKVAKLVLAYCQVEREEYGEAVHGTSYGFYGTGYTSGGRSKQVLNPFRDAIGDVLLAELIKMVDAHERTATYTVQMLTTER